MRTTPRTRTTTAVTAALAAATLAACGGMDAEEFRGEARRLCAAEDRAANDAGVSQARSPRQLADALDRARRASRPIQEEFAELEPPDELERAHADYVRLNRDGDRLLERSIRGLRGDQRAATQAVQELARSAPALTRRSDEIARRLGVPGCGEGAEQGAES
jgi:hypothetical protein